MSNAKTDTEIAALLDAAIAAQDNPRINQATVWVGTTTGRVRVYWGGDSYLEYQCGAWASYGFARKQAERLLTAVRTICGAE